ncbi:PTS sugar transporter subunit IIB [Enterococcus rotai]|uniref:PTS sugar transporter subunit IIB n=1 Tax=Enterococcus rotai TaxID=118060 RepID=UPI0032B365DB
MTKKNILLVCGGGASSGFLAQSMKKSAKAQGLAVTVEAVGDSEIEDYIEDKDVVLFGPHLRYMEAELKETMDEFDEIPYDFIPDEYYGALDGGGTLAFALSLLKD